jgi:hypothetical protein
VQTVIGTNFTDNPRFLQEVVNTRHMHRFLFAYLHVFACEASWQSPSIVHEGIPKHKLAMQICDERLDLW